MQKILIALYSLPFISVFSPALNAQTRVDPNRLTIERLEEGVINQRPTSSRCRVLESERSRMVERRHDYVTLISRSDRLLNSLQTEIGPDDVKIRAQVQATKTRIENEILLLNQRIQNREENLVRTGCPVMRF